MASSFSQRLGFGQYQAVESPLTKLDPRTRILSVTVLLLSITFCSNIVLLILSLILLVSLYRISKCPWRQFWGIVKRMVPLLLFLSFFQLFLFTASVENALILQIWRWQITIQGLWAAFTVTIRFMVLILLVNLAGLTLSTSEIIYGLQSLLAPLRVLKLPVDDLVIVLQIALRFFPILTETVEQITKAQAARGGNWGNKEKNLFKRITRTFPILIPMFMVSLQKAENMALAMDARAYGTERKRSSYHSFTMKKFDWLVLAGVLLLSLALILL